MFTLAFLKSEAGCPVATVIKSENTERKKIVNIISKRKVALAEKRKTQILEREERSRLER
jgi:hypothetical protein